MSGEFGIDISNTFFHGHMNIACEILEGANLETTRELAKIYESLRMLARDISYAEADDSSEATLIFDAIKALPKIKEAVAEVESYLDRYENIAKELILQQRSK